MRAIYNTNTHSATQASTHSARNSRKEPPAAPRDYRHRGSNPGVRTRAEVSGHSATLPAPCLAPTAAYGFRGRAEKDNKSPLNTHYKKFSAAPPPIAACDYTRTLNDTHTRVRASTHTPHKFTTQTRLYTTCDSKQGLNSLVLTTNSTQHN